MRRKKKGVRVYCFPSFWAVSRVVHLLINVLHVMQACTSENVDQENCGVK